MNSLVHPGPARESGQEVPNAASPSYLVVANQVEWAEPLVRSVARQVAQMGETRIVVWIPRVGAVAALRKRFEAVGLDPHRVDFVTRTNITAASIKRELDSRPGFLPVVGPLPIATLVDLVFTTPPADSAAPRPLIVVPRAAWTARPSSRARSVISVGFHGSGPARAALTWAVEEASRRDGLVRAVMAWSEGEYGGLSGCVQISSGSHRPIGVTAKAIADGAVESAGLMSGRVTVVARRGTPGAVLVQESADCDLVVVGAGQSLVHGHRVLGPVTLGCAARSRVPVAIVPMTIT